MNRKELEHRLLDFVNRMLADSHSRPAVDEETALFEEGVIDSLRILHLIAFVEEVTDRKVPDAAVRLANFRSVRTIATAFAEDGVDGWNESPKAAPNGGPPWSAGRPLHIFERRSGRACLARPFEELEARGELALVAPGRAVIRGTARRLLEYFDSLARVWAHALGAAEVRYPRLLPLDTLLRAGCPVDPASQKRAVPPAVCYHVYRARAGEQLGPAPVLLTARGRCFRDESGTEPSLERLRSFEMREIVALGSREDVERFREQMLEKVCALVVELDLEGRIEIASDPFFLQDRAFGRMRPDGVPDPRARRLMQQVLPLKYELRLALDEDGRSSAVASFNHHLDFFGRRFEIQQTSGEAAHSGCVAFGLERWMLAFLSQHGTEERAWSTPVRDFCTRKVGHERLG